jgi:hypothetical protein
MAAAEAREMNSEVFVKDLTLWLEEWRPLI